MSSVCDDYSNYAVGGKKFGSASLDRHEYMKVRVKRISLIDLQEWRALNLVPVFSNWLVRDQVEQPTIMASSA